MVSVERCDLVNMTESMVYRGPDSNGFYLDKNVGFGMRRLAIVDIGGGDQPISNEDGRIHVVLNGEIYNHSELRSKLKDLGHLFKTQSDTEVLVHLYEEYGFESVQMLNGMFSFALYDKARCIVWIARDRIGIKPLYYHLSGDRLLFGSTSRSVELGVQENKRIDVDGLALYLGLGYIPAPRSIRANVKMLEPGTMMRIEGQNVVIEKYWDKSNYLKKGLADDMALSPDPRIIRQILNSSIELQGRSDHPVAVFLSGGIDSSITLGLQAKVNRGHTVAYTADYRGKDVADVQFSKRISDLYGVPNITIPVTPGIFIDAESEMLRRFDEPAADSASVGTYLLSKAVRRDGIKIAVGGAGGDEIFGGYRRYVDSWIKKVVNLVPRIPTRCVKYGLDRQFVLPRLIVLLGRRPMAYGFGTAGVDPAILFSMCSSLDSVLRIEDQCLREMANLTSYESEFGPIIGRMALDISNYLPDNVLSITDRASMAASIEARVPLLDHRLIEYALACNNKLHSNLIRQQFKKCLIEACSDLLPIDVVRRRKVGFNPPVRQWLNGVEFKEEIERYLRKIDDNPLSCLLSKQKVLEMWRDNGARTRGFETFYMIYHFSKWFEVN